MLYTFLSVIVILLLATISLISSDSMDRRYPGTKNPASRLFFIYLVITIIGGLILYYAFSYFGIS